MHSLILPLLFATPQAGGATGEGGATSGIITFLPFILIIAIFYFLIIRPQNKKQKEEQKMRESVRKGDKIVTIGGIHGTVSNVRESTIIVKVDDNTKIELSKTAIGSVVPQNKDVEPTKELDKKDSDKKDGDKKDVEKDEKKDGDNDKKDEAKDKK